LGRLAQLVTDRHQPAGFALGGEQRIAFVDRDRHRLSSSTSLPARSAAMATWACK
jgi:hypothetical protein